MGPGNPLAPQAKLSFQAAVFAGPIPPPEILESYGRVLPSAPERIITMAENQARHRHKLETRGQWFGFILATVMLGGAIVLLALGKEIAGFAALATAVCGVILAYRESKRNDQPS